MMCLLCNFVKQNLRGALFIVRARNNIMKADFMHTIKTTSPTEMKIGIYHEELK